MSSIWQAQLERFAQRTNQTKSLEDSARRAWHPSPTEFIQHTTTRDRERCKNIHDFDVGRTTTMWDREESDQLRRNQSNNISDSPYAAFFKTAARQPRQRYSNLRESASQRQSNLRKQFTIILTVENGKLIQQTQQLATLLAETENIIHQTQQWLKQVHMVWEQQRGQWQGHSNNMSHKMPMMNSMTGIMDDGMDNMDTNGNMGYGGDCNSRFELEDNGCATNNIKCDDNTPSKY